MNKRPDGPPSNEQARDKDELGFDPDSPDVSDRKSTRLNSSHWE